jgi:small subunit ribosomal protein S1
MEESAMETTPLAPETTVTQDLDSLKRKTQFSGKVIKTSLAGAVIDIGLPIPGVVHISQLSTSPVNRVEDVVQVGQSVDVWVRRVFPKKDRIELTMVKPLDLEWREIDKDLVVKGKVVRIEKFGIFVDIGAERPGLVHISEMTHDYIKSPTEIVKEGDEVEIKVLSVNRQKKQIKLSMKALEEKPVKVARDVQQAKPSTKAEKAASVEQVEKEEPVPTAMEVAFREAMERSNDYVVEAPVKVKKTAGTQDEMDKILSRTLEQKVKTGR